MIRGHWVPQMTHIQGQHIFTKTPSLEVAPEQESKGYTEP